MTKLIAPPHPCVGCPEGDRYYCADTCKKLLKWEREVDLLHEKN